MLFLFPFSLTNYLHINAKLLEKIGLFAAMFMRIGLLFMLTWIIGMTAPLFAVAGNSFSGRDLVFILGGLFLLWKSVGEIHQMLEGGHSQRSGSVHAAFGAVILQIMLIDLVFSLDSIITAVGMVDRIEIMVSAVVASVGLMMLFAGVIGRFVSAHPTFKVLALAFLVAIGMLLIAEGFGTHVPKGYIYSAMAFAVVVELINMRLRNQSSRPAELIASIAEERGVRDQ